MRTLSSLTPAVICLATLGLYQSDAAQNAERAAPAAEQKKEPAPVPVPIEEGKVALTPKNTMIQFVGAHMGPKPDPRTGYFANFKGQMAVNESASAPQAVLLEIDTASLVTPIGRLTGHLQSPDFFDVRRYPKATFQSTKIEGASAAGGKCQITGDLTIRDVTKSITFPATVQVTDEGLVLTSKFHIKRLDFGMDFGPDRVVNEVAMTVVVGKATPEVTPQ